MSRKTQLLEDILEELKEINGKIVMRCKHDRMSVDEGIFFHCVRCGSSWLKNEPSPVCYGVMPKEEDNSSIPDRITQGKTLLFCESDSEAILLTHKFMGKEAPLFGHKCIHCKMIWIGKHGSIPYCRVLNKP